MREQRHARSFRFGEFELDEGSLELRRTGAIVPLQPKPLALLLYLLEHRNRSVPKQELLDWWGAAVSDTALSSALKNLRRALQDECREPRWIRTRKKVGYQFVGAVAVETSNAAKLEADDASPKSIGGLCGVPRGLSMAFVGRVEEVRRLEEVLTRETYLSVQASIEGLPGIGKTELALQLVHKLAYERRFPGGIFWLDGGAPDLQSIWGTLIADRCGVAPGSTSERCQKVMSLLGRTREPVLVVLDDVTAWSPRSMPKPIPEGPHIRVLITTRERNLGGPQFVHLELGRDETSGSAHSCLETLVRALGRGAGTEQGRFSARRSRRLREPSDGIPAESRSLTPRARAARSRPLRYRSAPRDCRTPGD